MSRFLIVSFAVLAWVFWELSGGAEFEPPSKRLAEKPEGAEIAVSENRPAKPVPRSENRQTEAKPKPADPVVERQEVTDNAAAAPLTTVVAQPAVERDEPPDAEQAAPPVVQAPVSGERSGPIVSLQDGELVLASPLESARLNILADPAPAQVLPVPEPARDLRRVRVGRANMREGPGTSFGISDRLTLDTEVEVLSDPGNGWIYLRRADGSGPEGWIGARLIGPLKE